jgi:hypothetical protein
VTGTLLEALDRLLAAEDTDTFVEALWQCYAEATEIPAGGAQWIESRRCFFAGGGALFQAALRIVPPVVEADPRALARLVSIGRELVRFTEDVGEHRG